MRAAQIVICVFISILSVLAYHQYLKSKGVFGPHLRGIYTVNLSEVSDQLKRSLIERTLKGENVNPEEEVSRLQDVLEKIAERIPDGYLLLPDSVVLGGERRKIDLLKGTIKEVRGFKTSSNSSMEIKNSQKR